MKLVYYVLAPGWTIKDFNYYTKKQKHTQNQEQMSKGTCVAPEPCHSVVECDHLFTHLLLF